MDGRSSHGPDGCLLYMKMANADSIDSTRLLELYAAVVHSGIALAYGFTLLYHFRKKSWGRIGLHLLGFGYHLWAVKAHARTPQTPASF